jgi:tetratricopeptide (TPR) repeat protein
MRGIVYARQRKRDVALACADTGLALDPMHRDCLNLRALVLGMKGETAAAQHTIHSSLSLDPEYALTHAHQGFLLLRQGRCADAEATFAEALRVEPTLRYAQRGHKLARAGRRSLLGPFVRYMVWLGWMSRGRRVLVMLAPVVAVYLLIKAETAWPAHVELLEALQALLMVLIWALLGTIVWVGFVLLRSPRRR